MNSFKASTKSIRDARQIIEPGLSGRQIAVVHGVTTKTVQRWAERGEFEQYRLMPGNRIEVPVSVYQSFVARHELAAPKLRSI